jgi:hypothetical protein
MEQKSILLTQGLIHEIFEKKILRIGGIEKLSFFESVNLEFNSDLIHFCQENKNFQLA